MRRKIVILLSCVFALIFAVLFYSHITISYISSDRAYNYLYNFTGIDRSQVLHASGWGTVRVAIPDFYKNMYFTLTLSGWEEFKRSSELLERSWFHEFYYKLDPSIFSSERKVFLSPTNENIYYYYSKSFRKQVFCIKRDDEVDVYLR